MRTPYLVSLLGVAFLILAVLVIRQNTSNQRQPLAKSENIQIKDLHEGGGREVKTGDRVSIHYVGSLLNGQEFDNSRKQGKPFEFVLGQGEVIKGFEQGIVGMQAGGKRELKIPSALAYGAQKVGIIPANSDLVFEIELLKIF